ncbi:MAG: amidohydrolase family protein, partial [Planctomycetota bacterium]
MPHDQASGSGCAVSLSKHDFSGLVALEGMTLIDGNGGQPVRNAAVVLDDERILHVGQSGDFCYPEGTAVYDLVGRFVIPGLIDMHAHPVAGVWEDTVRMLLGFGVTTFRSPGGNWFGVDLRDQIANGELLGPRMFTGSKIIDGPDTIFPFMNIGATEAEMRTEIRRQADLGVDLIKLYWVTPADLITVAVDEAHALDLQVAGHLREVSWTEAAQLGIDNFEHSAGEGPIWELVAPEERAALRALPRPEYLQRFAELVDLDSPWFDDLVTALVDNQVTVTPTLVTMQSLHLGDDLGVLDQLDPWLASDAILGKWDSTWKEGNPFVFVDPIGKVQGHLQAPEVFPIGMEIV